MRHLMSFTYCSQREELGEAMHLVLNERTKHRASWLNSLATALIAAGAFAPAAALLYGLSPSAIAVPYVAAVVIGCFTGGLSLHLIGSILLGRLRELTGLEIYVLLAPALVVLVGIAAVCIGIWMDRREDRRRARQ